MFTYKQKRNLIGLEPGFTFMELIIAIAILAVLALLLAPAYFGYIAKAKVGSTETNLAVLKQAVDSFYLDSGRYPASLSDLMHKPGDLPITKWHGPYLDREIPNDGWDNAYAYRVNPKGKQPPYDLFSYGPNGPGSPTEEWISARK